MRLRRHKEQIIKQIKETTLLTITDFLSGQKSPPNILVLSCINFDIFKNTIRTEKKDRFITFKNMGITIN